MPKQEGAGIVMRHIFLTGEKQVGKSTLWRRALAARPHTGFVTRPFTIDGEKKGYTLHSLTPLPPGLNDCPCVLRVGPRRHVAVLPVFEEAGVQALNQALSAPLPLILMDEIGKAERDASGFAEAVRRCLDSDRHVLGVLQLGDAPLQAYIRQREDVLLLTVTPENRDELLAAVEAHLTAWDEEEAEG